MSKPGKRILTCIYGSIIVLKHVLIKNKIIRFILLFIIVVLYIFVKLVMTVEIKK